MAHTVVLQSHTDPFPYDWLAPCTGSVKRWSESNAFEYRFIDDALFDYLPGPLAQKTRRHPIIASDLARLKLIQDFLNRGFDTVIWCDADFLIFNPANFLVPDESFAVGREVWIQTDRNHSRKLSAHVKVHNAFMMFRTNNSFLDFYVDSAERLLTKIDGPIPPQFIGPKLLTAIHNIVQCPVLETAGMLSPRVMVDLEQGTGLALDLFRAKSVEAVAAANLCASLFANGETSARTIDACIDRLLMSKDADL
ncbi:MAG: hypothetical protein O3C28_08970 [Proteobacteria bacterium]|nr:hypothetical protein [Pseudomonadota bacterium]